jgi:mediator of RNA polymerase II transcription subunit 17
MILAATSLFCTTSLLKEKGSTNRTLVRSATCQASDICQSKEPPSAKLASTLTKIFAERGFDIFEKRDDPSRTDEGPDTSPDDMIDETDAAQKPMSVDELYAMRMEIMPHLLFVYSTAAMGLSEDLS